MVRLTEESATHFDWLNGDIRALREDYARVRAKPVPADATWHRIGADPDAVPVLRFPGDGEAIAYEMRARLAPASPLGEKVAEGRMRGSQPLARRFAQPLICPSGIFSPRGEAKAAIIYFHGGGFIVGSPVTHADIAARLAHHTGLPVYSVDYRLAPDHQAPAPADDGVTVIRHLIETGIEHLIICGDSAGGAIALATEAGLSDDLRRHVIAVASFYGAYGILDTESIRSRGNLADGTDRDCVNRYFELAGREAYSIETLAGLIANEKEPLPNPSPQGGGATSPYPLASSEADERHESSPPLRGVSSDPRSGAIDPVDRSKLRTPAGQRGSFASGNRAPIYLIAAENDALRDDTLILAGALTTSGRTVTLDCVPNVDHGFLHGGESNRAAEAALAHFAAWLAAQ